MQEIFNEEQLEFITKAFNQTRNDRIIEDMSRLKSFVPQGIKNIELLNDSDSLMAAWEVNVFRAESKIYRCICGKKIKNEYRLIHKHKEITLSLGAEHYRQYCGVSVSKVEKIRETYQKYIAVLDELTKLMRNGEYERQKCLIYLDDLPDLMKNQLELGIPLNKSQIENLEKKSSDYFKTISCLKKIETKLLDQMAELSESEQRAIIIKLKNGMEIISLNQLQNIDYDDICDREKVDSKAMNHNESQMIKEVISNQNFILNQEHDLVSSGNKITKDNSTRLQSSRFNPRAKFLESIKDENERKSIIENTETGMNKISVKEAQQYSTKLYRQVSFGFSLSDQQMNRMKNPRVGDAEFWKFY